MKIANWLKSIEASPTLAVNEKANALRAEGRKIISLVVGEPDFNTPEFVKKEVCKALELNITRYTATEGTEGLRKAISKKLSTDNDIHYDIKDIIVTCGAKQAISTALCVLINEGEEVLIPAPYWVSYPAMVRIARGVPVIVNTEAKNKYKLTIDDLEKALTSKSKVLILNNPSNPTGVMYEKDELMKIAKWCVKNNIIIISDEIYEKIVFSGKKFIATASLGDDIYKNVVTINGTSKSHCMTGWRIGYAAGPSDIIKAMKKFQSHFLSHITSFVQYATIAAISNDEFIQPMVKEYEHRINKSLELIKEYMPKSSCVVPDGTFYLFPSVDKYFGKYKNIEIKDSVDLAKYFLDKASVAVVPGSAFGMDNNIRLSVATSMKEIEDGIKAIGKALSELKN